MQGFPVHAGEALSIVRSGEKRGSRRQDPEPSLLRLGDESGHGPAEPKRLVAVESLTRYDRGGQ
jgi:hypothetical protein